MDIFKWATIILLAVSVLIILVFAARTKRALRCLLINSFLGISVFLILYFTKKFTGIVLALNVYTALGSAIFGIPAVIGFLLLNLIF